MGAEVGEDEPPLAWLESSNRFSDELFCQQAQQRQRQRQLRLRSISVEGDNGAGREWLPPIKAGGSDDNEDNDVSKTKSEQAREMEAEAEGCFDESSVGGCERRLCQLLSQLLRRHFLAEALDKWLGHISRSLADRDWCQRRGPTSDRRALQVSVKLCELANGWFEASRADEALKEGLGFVVSELGTVCQRLPVPWEQLDSLRVLGREVLDHPTAEGPDEDGAGNTRTEEGTGQDGEEEEEVSGCREEEEVSSCSEEGEEEREGPWIKSEPQFMEVIAPQDQLLEHSKDRLNRLIDGHWMSRASGSSELAIARSRCSAWETRIGDEQDSDRDRVGLIWRYARIIKLVNALRSGAPRTRRPFPATFFD